MVALLAGSGRSVAGDGTRTATAHTRAGRWMRLVARLVAAVALTGLVAAVAAAAALSWVALIVGVLVLVNP